MAKIIDIDKTVANILAVEEVQFKLLKRDREKNLALLATPVNDDFQRGVIAIDENKFSVGLQSPNEEGVLTVTYQPISAEFFEVVTLVEDQAVEEAEAVEAEVVEESKE